MAWPRYRLAVLCVFLALVAACAPEVKKQPPKQAENLRLTPVSFDQLPGWTEGNQGGVLAALKRSCEKLPKAAGSGETQICAGLGKLDETEHADVRAFFEQHYIPYLAANNDEPAGLFTGYFEAELRGARNRDTAFQVPIYKLPADHVVVDLGDFDPSLPKQRIVGQLKGGRLKPYYKRGEIQQGVLANRGDELVWVDDAIDAFVLHVQGSGRVNLRDGTTVRIGFAGHNGHPYTSIGRTLIKRGELEPGQASWQDIRQWIERNRDKAAALFAENNRYIFFREIAGDGPLGAQGVALTPGRSLAVDRRFIPLGIPIWLDTTWPAEDKPLRRLMVSQDTGSAIKGPVRGDFFWGFGAEALAFAGRMKSRGRYYLLLPRTDKRGLVSLNGAN